MKIRSGQPELKDFGQHRPVDGLSYWTIKASVICAPVSVTVRMRRARVVLSRLSSDT